MWFKGEKVLSSRELWKWETERKPQEPEAVNSAHINLLSSYFRCGTCTRKTDQSRQLCSPTASKSFWLLLYSGLCHSRPIHFTLRQSYSKKEATNNVVGSRFSVLEPMLNGNHLAIWQTIEEIQHFSIQWIMTFYYSLQSRPIRSVLAKRGFWLVIQATWHVTAEAVPKSLSHSSQQDQINKYCPGPVKTEHSSVSLLLSKLCSFLLKWC